MKKLPTLFLSCAFSVIACNSNNFANMSSQVKSIGKGCKEVLGGNKKAGTPVKDNDVNNISSVLPAYFWDTKSMIR